MTLGVAAFIGWAAWFDIDQSVRALGTVIPGARTQVIQAADGGVLAELRVQEGDVVKTGQVLAVLEPDRARAAYDESAAKLMAQKAALLRAKAESNGSPPSFGTEYKAYPELVAAQQNLYRQRRLGLDENLATLNEFLALAQEELRINETLFKQGDTSRVELLRAQRQVGELRARSTETRNKYLQEARVEAARLEEDLSSQRYRQKERRSVLEHTELTSPVDGVVKSLRVNTVGGVLRGGDELMQISPTDGELLIEIKLNPTDIGPLRPGLAAALRLDAFDASLYGTLAGELVYISSDTLTEPGPNNAPQTSYRGRIRLAPDALVHNPKFAAVVIRPGMTATVDINTGQRSVLHYLFKPINRAFSGALNER
ncbi:MAG: hypothetical protein RLZZ618_2694 [Pseudomonadota bacterium]